MSDGVAGTDVLLVDLVQGRYADVNTAGPQSSGSGFDGVHAWTTDGSGTTFVQGNRETRDDLRQRSLLYSSVGRGPVGEVAIRDPDSGAARRLTFPSFTRGFDVYADDPDGEPWQVVTYSGSDSTVMTFSKYRTIAGIEMPTRIKSDWLGDSQENDVVRAEPLQSVDASAFAPPPLPNDTSLSGVTTVPIEYRDDCPIVVVEVNGVRLHMLLDTGGTDGITPAAAKRAGLAPVGKSLSFGFGAGSLPTQFAMVDRVRIGQAEIRHQEFDVLDDSHDSFHADGTIGAEFFARFAVEIDPLRDTLRIARDGALLRPSGDRLDIVFDTEQPQLDGTLDDLRGAMTIDSGSSFVDVMRPTVLRYDLCKRMHSTGMVTGGGIGGANQGCVAHAKTMTLGTHRENNVLLSLAVSPDSGFDDDSTIANIGSPILDNNVVVYDYQRATIWMRPL